MVCNMVLTKKTQPKRPPKELIIIRADNIEHVKEFTYLSSQVNNSSDITSKIKQKIFLANKVYYDVIKHLTSDTVSRKTKWTIYEILIRP